MAQYVMSMLRVSKTVPPQATDHQGHFPVLLPRRQDRPAGPQRLRQVDRAAHHGQPGQETTTAKCSTWPASRSATCRRNRSSTRTRPCARKWKAAMGEVIEGAGQAGAGLRRLRRTGRPTSTSSPRNRRGLRRSSPRPAPTPRTRWRSPPTPCACRRGDASIRNLSGGEKRRVARCASCCSRAARTCCCSTSRPTTSTPNRSNGWSQYLCRFPGTVVARHPRPLLPRQRRRVDSRTRPRPRHPVEGQLLLLAGAEGSTPRNRAEAARRAHEGDEAGTRMGALQPQGRAQAKSKARIAPLRGNVEP